MAASHRDIREDGFGERSKGRAGVRSGERSGDRSGEISNRLQPALLDRLADDDRSARDDSDSQRTMTRAQLRQAVLRDLGALFNAVQPLGAAAASAWPMLEGSVLNYGLPALSGQLASKLDVTVLERAIRDAIVRFEPRILPETLQVRALEASSVLDTHNVIEFEIRGHLWSQPVPLEILLRTQLDLEAGQVEVRDATGPGGPGRTFGHTVGHTVCQTSSHTPGRAPDATLDAGRDAPGSRR